MPLHAEVDGLLAQLRANLTLAENLTRGLSRTQFNWSAEPGRWSIAQCLGHLNRIDGGDLPRLATVVESARSQGVNAAGPFHYRLVVPEIRQLDGAADHQEILGTQTLSPATRSGGRRDRV